VIDPKCSPSALRRRTLTESPSCHVSDSSMMSMTQTEVVDIRSHLNGQLKLQAYMIYFTQLAQQ